MSGRGKGGKGLGKGGFDELKQRLICPPKEAHRVDEARDALAATTACKAADGRLGDALDVVTEHLAVALSASLSESLTALATSRHCCWLLVLKRCCV